MLIVGLGNPGETYENTRHNAGNIVVEALTGLDGFECIQLEDVYMNQSGRAVRQLMMHHRAELKDLIIVHDDWAFEVGEYRIQKNRSANRHNGVLSIIGALGSQDFWRVRIGIGSVPVGMEASDYVLGRFKKAELEALNDVALELRFELPRVIS